MIDINTDFNLADPLATEPTLQQSPLGTLQGTAESTEVCDFSDPTVASFTTQFVGLKKNLNISSTDMVIRMGEVLIAVRPHLENCYYAWLETVGISSSTAHNYVQLKNFAEENPNFHTAWKDLGPAKLYKVISLPPAERESLLSDEKHEELVRMSCREFDSYLTGVNFANENENVNENVVIDPFTEALSSIKDGISLLDGRLHAFGGDIVPIIDPVIKEQYCSEIDHLVQHLLEFKAVFQQ